jgi:hypothetical protein
VSVILRFLADYCGFLFRPDGFRFVDSVVDERGNARVLLESAVLRLRFDRERSELTLSFQPTSGKGSKWYSPGLLRGLLLRDRGGSELLNEDWARFLETAIGELEKRLSDPESVGPTISALDEQANRRSKELFG